MDQQTTVSDKSPAAATVHHVSRKCSDQLLSKFADPGNEDFRQTRKGLIWLPSRRPKRVRRTSDGELSENPSRWSGGSFAERRLLLPPVKKKRSRSLRKIIVRSSERKRPLLGSIEETWRRTLEGASRVFFETHYNGHKRLVSDAAV